MIRRLAALVLLCVWLAGVLAAAASLPSGTVQAPEIQAAKTQAAKPAPEKVRTEPLRPAPQTIREKWGIRVFLAWLWFTTGVLLYLFRRMIREADRVHGLGYSTPKSARPKKCEPQS